MHVFLCAVLSLATVLGSELLDLEETNVALASKVRAVTSVVPNVGTAAGGTRVHVNGEGFATEFFSGSNQVYIGSDSFGWYECNVIEGACTVDCGGHKKIVCDTSPVANVYANSGWLEVWVVVNDGIQEYDVYGGNYYYSAVQGATAPRLRSVEPRHAHALGVVTLRGENFGESIADVRTIYVGAGRPPQGGNINDGTGARQSTHALCRADDLNLAMNIRSGRVDNFSLPVMVEDAVIGHDTPILDGEVNCYLGDFGAGSYTASMHLGSSVRSGLAGLTHDAVANRSRDAFGAEFVLQYYPHVSRVQPRLGSLEGGTILTIDGGGFSDDEALVHVDVAGVECEVLEATLVQIKCRTGDLSTKEVGVAPYHDELADVWADNGYQTPAAIGPASYGWNVSMARALDRGGAWVVASDDDDDSGGVVWEAPGCPGPPCTPSWAVLAPGNVSFSGTYEVTLHVPAAHDCVSTTADAARTFSVVVSDAVRGYVHVNVSVGDSSPVIGLGNFSFARGLADGRRGAVIVDTVGAAGCVAVKGVEARRVGRIGGGDCSDPLAVNYEAAPAGAGEVVSSKEGCIYVGSRGLNRRQWSLMTPEYREKPVVPADVKDAYALGAEFTCPTPDANSTTWRNDSAYYHGRCPARSFCCIDGDNYGCDPRWDKADHAGFVDVLRQDVQWGRQFRVDEFRRNAHANDPANYAILDDLEEMRDLKTGRIELKLDWPGSDRFVEEMHWSQRLNPALYTGLTRDEQHDEDPQYVSEATPYSYNYWGGLEYNGVHALLDGSFDNADWFFSVGSVDQPTGTYVTRGFENEYADWTRSRKTRLRARPNPFYFEPTCIDCAACYDGDGYRRGPDFRREVNASWDCRVGASCYFDHILATRVIGVPCPEECDGLPIRAFEVHAAHEAAVVAAKYVATTTTTTTTQANCTDLTTGASSNATCGDAEVVTTGVSSATKFPVGVQTFEGFFVAPLDATYTFKAAWDASLEVLLSDSADPRGRRVIVGGPLHEPRAEDRSTADGWYFWGGHRYKYVDDLALPWHEALDHCKSLGGYLFEPNTFDELSKVVVDTGASDAAWLGITDEEDEGLFRYATQDPASDESFVSTGLRNSGGSSTVAYGNRLAAWNTGEPNDWSGIENCAENLGLALRWNDLSCTRLRSFICEVETALGVAEPVRLKKGEARYFEMVHTFNSSTHQLEKPRALHLWLNVAPDDDDDDGGGASTGSSSYETYVSGDHSLSMEFFRTKATAPEVDVRIGLERTADLGNVSYYNDYPEATFASACLKDAVGAGRSESGPRQGACAFEYSEAATPVLEAVFPTRGSGGDLLTLTGFMFGTAISEVEVAVGGATCDVVAANGTSLTCVLRTAEAQAGTYSVRVRVFGLGEARYATAVVTFAVDLRVDAFAPRNGSVYAGDTIQVWGAGFARLGTNNRVTVGGVTCVPKTMKNRACRVSLFDSGMPCAWTVEAWRGYAMVISAYAPSAVRNHAEWLDFSNTTYIECVLENQPPGEPLVGGGAGAAGGGAANGTAVSGPVVVTLLDETALYDAEGPELAQRLTDRDALALDQATRNLDCAVLLGYRVWNVVDDDSVNGTERPHSYDDSRDCVLWDANYNKVGAFGATVAANFTGASVVTSANYTFLWALTPVVASLPRQGMAGQKVQIRGTGFEPTRAAHWDTAFRMDEFGFYAQPEAVTVYVGAQPAVVTFRNDTLIEAIPTYNAHDVAHDVTVHVLGKGLAGGDPTYVFTTYIYSVTPNVGSTEGGTVLTITGSGFVSTHAFYSTEQGNDLGSSVADYSVHLINGQVCDVTKASRFELECVTRPINPADAAVDDGNNNAVLFADDDAWTDKAEVVVVDVFWNYEPYRFDCAHDACVPPGCIEETEFCKFMYAGRATPLVEVRPPRTTEDDGAAYVAPGDTVELELVSTWEYNWTSIREDLGGWDALFDKMTVTVGADRCGALRAGHRDNRYLGDHKWLVNCTVPVEAVPEADAEVRVLVAKFGYARVAGKKLPVRPFVAALSRNVSSIHGGLPLRLYGAGFQKGSLQSAGITTKAGASYALCEDLTVVSPTEVACTTQSYYRYPRTEAQGVLTLSGTVFVVVNGVQSVACGQGDCVFNFSSVAGAHTPVVYNMSTREGTHDSSAPQLVEFTGEGLLDDETGIMPGMGKGHHHNLTVMMGYARAKVVGTPTAASVLVQVPEHAAGCWSVQVISPHKGRAVMFRAWFDFGLEVESASYEGSVHGGQRIRVKGRGFAPCGGSAEGARLAASDGCITCRDAALHACAPPTQKDGVKVVTSVAKSLSSGTYFGADVVATSFDTMDLVTHLRGLDGTVQDASIYGWSTPEDAGAFEVRVRPEGVVDDVLPTLRANVIEQPSRTVAYSAQRFAVDGSANGWVVAGAALAPYYYDDRHLVYDTKATDVPIGGYALNVFSTACEAPFLVEGSEDGVEWFHVDRNGADVEALFHPDGTPNRALLNATVCDYGVRTYRRALERPGLWRYLRFYFFDIYSWNKPAAGATSLALKQFKLYRAVPDAGTTLTYARSAAATPQVTYIYPDEEEPRGTFRTILRLRGQGFGAAAAEDVSVAVGGWDCPTLVANETFVSCATPNVSAGIYPVTVTTRAWGLAGPVKPFYYAVKLEAYNMTPTRGSMAGGTKLTIEGVGFSQVPRDNVVRLGGADCVITEASETFDESFEPSFAPTTLPTSAPTVGPTFSFSPTPAPTAVPTTVPSALPTSLPTRLPTSTPTPMPASVPTAVPTSPPSMLPSSVPTPIPTAVPTSVPTPVPLPAPSPAPSGVPTAAPTHVPLPAPTSVPTTSPAPTTETGAPSVLPTSIPSTTPSSTPSSVPSALPSSTPSARPSASPTANPTSAPSVPPTTSPAPSTATPTSFTHGPSTVPTAAPTAVPTSIPTAVPWPAPTSVPTAPPTSTPTSLPVSMPTTAPTSVPTSLPSTLPSSSPTSTPTVVPTLVPTTVPTATPTSVPTAAPTSAPTTVPTPIPAVVPSPVPTSVPTSVPTISSAPTGVPTAAPTAVPSPLPTAVPTLVPSPVPTSTPTTGPTSTPTSMPTPAPSFVLTAGPSSIPTAAPTAVPSTPPSPAPTSTPTPAPTSVPTAAPTTVPTMAPTAAPASTPTGAPTPVPTAVPSPVPSPAPTHMPTPKPTHKPTSSPTGKPTNRYPTREPTRRPTRQPTPTPTLWPTAPTAAPTAEPSAAPTKPANFTGFNYVATLECTTGALVRNVSKKTTIGARSVGLELATKMRSNEVLRLHAGGPWSSNSAGFGKASYLATSAEPDCRQLNRLHDLVSKPGLGFIFYDPRARAVRATYRLAAVTAAGSDLVIDWIDSFKAEWAELIFMVHTSYYPRISSAPRLVERIKNCGGTSTLFQTTTAQGQALLRPYVLVSKCGLEEGWALERGLERLGERSDGLTIDVKVDDYFPEMTNSGPAVQVVKNHPLNFTFDPALTTELVALDRFNGSTAGGTTVRVNLTNMAQFHPSTTNVTVTIGGVECALDRSRVLAYRGRDVCDWDGVFCGEMGVVTHADNVTTVTCITNPWDYSGDAKTAAILVSLDPHGYAANPRGLTYGYVDLWSALTTWGGDVRNKPAEGDSVTIAEGQYIVLDESPPSLFLLIIYGGTLEFSPDVGDLALNASYVFVYGGRLIVGTEKDPFPHSAIITLEGDQNALELPVYGAKCIGVRDAVLDMHGLRRTPYTRLAETVRAGNATLVLQDATDWRPGDKVFVASTSFDPVEAEERSVEAVSEGGTVVKLDRPLYYDHWGDGYWDPTTGVEVVPEYRAEVGLLTRNVVIQGDDQSKRVQFGAQVVFASSRLYDNSLIGRLSNVEVRQAGQGLKLGKYPLHFHRAGNVSKSYISNCTVHHTHNRAIAIHGVNKLRVDWNVVFDVRGHAVFIEDGTEVRNVIAHNLVAVVRPVWSLLLVDQSPACFWITNPLNDVYKNIAAGSSHYGFWYRALEHPDGVTGQQLIDENILRCPMYTKLGRMDGNVAHSTRRHGTKISDFFPAVNGLDCATNTFGEPAEFADFVGYNNGRFGVWGEFLVEVNFRNLRILNPGIGGIEFLYMNGRQSEFAKSSISDSLFVGRTTEMATAGPGDMCEGLQDVNGAVNHDGNGCIHAIHLPGIGSELEVTHTRFVNFEAPMWTCSWCVGIKGGYEVDFENVSYVNTTRPATFKKGFGGDIATSGILNDRDGSLGSGAAGGAVVPYAPHFANNEHCTLGLDAFDVDLGAPEYFLCTRPVRRVSFKPAFTSAYSNRLRLYKFPHFQVIDLTDWRPGATGGDFTAVAREPHWVVQSGDQSCVEQAPKGEYLFLAGVGRKYGLFFRDQLGIPVTAGGEFYASKMKANETMVFHLNHKAPFQPAAAWAESRQLGSSRWGENTVAIGWEPAPPPLPDYKVGAPDGSPCALGEFEACAADPFYRTPELADPLRYDEGGALVVPEARPQGRTVRGGRLYAASGALPAGGWRYEDFVVAELSDYTEGSRLAFASWATVAAFSSSSKTPPEELPPVTERTRWRHGYDVDDYRFYDPDRGYHKSFGTNGTLAISPVVGHRFCWDVEHDAVDPKNRVTMGAVAHPHVELWLCDSSKFQDWEWIQGGKLRNAMTGACVGIMDESGTVASGVDLALYDCGTMADDAAAGGGTLLFDPSFLEPTPVNASHGLFHYDRAAGPEGYNPNAVTWDNASTTPWYFRGMIPYDLSNISTMSVLLAGNSTVKVETKACGPEGCPFTLPTCRTCGSRDFFWSTGDVRQDAINWNVTDDPKIDVPSDFWSGTIWDDWTVTIAAETVTVNRLLIRGLLKFAPHAARDVILHAHFVEILGGTLQMGTPAEPIDNRTRATLMLHGDKYRTLVRKDGGWVKLSNFKRVHVNGNLTCHGDPLTSWTFLGDHARAGEAKLTLADAVEGWFAGDTVVLSNSLHHGPKLGNPRAKRYFEHVVLNISDDGRTVFVDPPLRMDYVGRRCVIDGTPSRHVANESAVVDVRTVVANLRRTVRIVGGDVAAFDRFSGFSASTQGWGASVIAKPAVSVSKPGWEWWMPGYETSGREELPAGAMSFHHVAFEMMGKGYWETPTRAWDGETFNGGVRFDKAQIDGAVVVGCTLYGPQALGQGRLTENYFLGPGLPTSARIEGNFFTRAAHAFRPPRGRTHYVKDNVFLSDSTSLGCGPTSAGICGSTKHVVLGTAAAAGGGGGETASGGGEIVFEGNYLHGAFGAALAIDGPCRQFDAGAKMWTNVIMSSYVGVLMDNADACASLPLAASRSVYGFMVGSVGTLTKVQSAENGIGVLPAGDNFQVGAQMLNGLPKIDPHSALYVVRDSTFIGTILPLQGAFSKEEEDPSEECSETFGLRAESYFANDDGDVAYRDAWEYVGIQRGGYGGAMNDRGGRCSYGDSAVDETWFQVRDVDFVAFWSEADACKAQRPGVALNNEPATVGRGSGLAVQALGNSMCYEAVTSGLNWVDSPPRGRMAFSKGSGGNFGTRKDLDAGYCKLYDEDGSLYGAPTGLARLYRADLRQEWDATVLRDCQAYAANLAAADDEEPGATNRCPWFVRENPYLLGAATNSARRGIADPRDRGRGDGSEPTLPLGCAPYLAGGLLAAGVHRVALCADDYTTVKYVVPERVVSGSEVLWSPVTWSTVKYESVATSLYGGDATVVALHTNYDYSGEVAQFLDRWPQPFTHVVPNRGAYRVDFTGDIGAFSEDGGSYDFQLLGTQAHAPVSSQRGVTEYAVIINLKIIKPAKILFYAGGRKINGATRRRQLTYGRPNGYGFQHATTKVAAFVLKGNEAVSVVALQVVQVTLAIAETFESFFADNLIDPSAIDGEFASQVPKTYGANYDPNGGAIVKENRFVRNMASVLQIDPGRIKVTNIVPGNRRRRRLADGRLLDASSSFADELDIQWQIEETDRCPEALECNNGICRASTGLCDCQDPWVGPYCNLTAPSPNNNNNSNATAAPTAAPTGAPTAASAFDELVALSTSLKSKAAAGQMDTGYMVTAMKVLVPNDACGVPGGNGTSCLDACGVVNGDGSACAPTAAPTTAASVAGGAFGICENATATVGTGEKQQVWIQATDTDVTTSPGLFGSFRLAFNGEVTEPLAVFASAAEVQTALAALPTVQTLGITVTGLLADGAISNTSVASGGVTQLRFGVEFTSTVRRTAAVMNLGDLPLVALDVAAVTGALGGAEVVETCPGEYRTGWVYPEQVVTMRSKADGPKLADLVANMRPVALVLATAACGNGTSSPFYPGASAAVVAEAMRAVGYGLVGEALAANRVEVFGNVTTHEATYTIRLYTLTSEPLTGCGVDAATLFDVPLAHNGSAVDDFVEITARVVEAGIVPASALPVDATIAAAEAAAAANDKVVVDDDDNFASVPPLVVVCGDGVYMSAEDCDDGNLDDGDGCSGNCTVEAGFVCTRPISLRSVCTVPVEATIQFLNSKQTYKNVAEGTSATISIERIGDNETACAVAYETVDSTATANRTENSAFTAFTDKAPLGDYAKLQGTLAFAAGEMVKTLTVSALEDRVYDGVADEIFLLRLKSTTCPGGFVNEETRLDAYIYVVDADVAPTPFPTSTPTTVPTAVPTMMPTSNPTLYPSISCAAGEQQVRLKAFETVTYQLFDVSSGSDVSLGIAGTTLEANDLYRDWFCLDDDACFRIDVTATADAEWRVDDLTTNSVTGRGASSVEFCLAGGVMGSFPTFSPTVSKDPTPRPTAEPSPSPTPIPTTAEPSVSPTSAPSALPTLSPTSVPTSMPTAVPTAVPTSFPSISCDDADDDRTQLYRYENPLGAPLTFDIIDTTSWLTIHAVATARHVGYLCLPDSCYVLRANLTSAATVATAELGLYPSQDEPGFTIDVPRAQYFHFCTQDDGTFWALPSPAPTISPVPTGVPTAAPSAVPTAAPTATPTTVPTPLPSALPTAAPTAAPTVEPTAVPTSYPSISCDSDDDDRTQLYRYENPAGAAIALVVRDTTTSEVVLNLTTDARAVGYVCLPDSCFVMSAALVVSGGGGGDESASADLGLYPSSRDEAGFVVIAPRTDFAFCTQDDGTFWALPSPAPTISPVPTGVPTLAPTTSAPSGAPTLSPMPTVTTVAPTSTELAVVIATTVTMNSEDAAAVILADGDKQAVLTTALAAGSEFARAEDTTITAVSDVAARRRALLVRSPIEVGFSLVVVASVFGYEDEADLPALVARVTVNLTDYVQSGRMTTAVAAEAALRSVTMDVDVPTTQTLVGTFTVRVIVTPDWVTEAPTAAAPRSSKKKKGDQLRSWELVLILILCVGSGTILLIYCALSVFSQKRDEMVHSNRVDGTTSKRGTQDNKIIPFYEDSPVKASPLPGALNNNNISPRQSLGSARMFKSAATKMGDVVPYNPGDDDASSAPAPAPGRRPDEGEKNKGSPEEKVPGGDDDGGLLPIQPSRSDMDATDPANLSAHLTADVVGGLVLSEAGPRRGTTSHREDTTLPPVYTSARRGSAADSSRTPLPPIQREVAPDEDPADDAVRPNPASARRTARTAPLQGSPRAVHQGSPGSLPQVRTSNNRSPRVAGTTTNNINNPRSVQPGSNF